MDGTSRVVWLSGVQAWDEEDAVVRLPGDDAGEQVRVTMRNIESILAELGGSLADLVRTVIYVVSLDDGATMGDAWSAYVEVMGNRQPATTLVGVTMLGHNPGEYPVVEIEATAALSG